MANRPSSSSLRTENLGVVVTGRAVMTISHPGFNDTSRKISRKRRLTWFRTVAFPTRLLTDKPNRACCPFRSRVRSSRRLDRQIRPCLAIAIKSFFSVTCLFIGVMRQCYRVGYSFTAIYAEMCSRPFRRLRFSTARPPRVRIRILNPWTRLRCRTLG